MARKHMIRTALLAALLAAPMATPLAEETGRQSEDLLPAIVMERCGFYAYRATVTDVYDGDTVTADVDLGFSTWRRGERLRLFGIDAPEVRGADRERGLVARDALRERVMGRDVVVCTIKDRTGKYGRYLAELWLGEENLNEWMIANGHAVPYDGGARAVAAALAGGKGRFVRARLR